jgi:hypothetical protein
LSKNQKQVDANSLEFRRGVEAGLGSEDTKFFEAGYELGQDLNEEAAKQRTKENTEREPDDPIFLADTLDGQKGDAQDDQGKSTE